MEIKLNDQAKKWQKIAREYADKYLQPHEIEAELNNGELSKELTLRNKKKAIELGFTAIDVPKSYGGLGLSMVEQVAIWEQLGRVTMHSHGVSLRRNLGCSMLALRSK